MTGQAAFSLHGYTTHRRILCDSLRSHSCITNFVQVWFRETIYVAKDFTAYSGAKPQIFLNTHDCDMICALKQMKLQSLIDKIIPS